MFSNLENQITWLVIKVQKQSGRDKYDRKLQTAKRQNFVIIIVVNCNSAFERKKMGDYHFAIITFEITD